ncbi:mucin-5AC-like [Homarus americanus]|nr:mucin-5AC-like [Homarus americanus]
MTTTTTSTTTLSTSTIPSTTTSTTTMTTTTTPRLSTPLTTTLGTYSEGNRWIWRSRNRSQQPTTTTQLPIFTNSGFGVFVNVAGQNNNGIGQSNNGFGQIDTSVRQTNNGFGQTSRLKLEGVNGEANTPDAKTGTLSPPRNMLLGTLIQHYSSGKKASITNPSPTSNGNQGAPTNRLSGTAAPGYMMPQKLPFTVSAPTDRLATTQQTQSQLGSPSSNKERIRDGTWQWQSKFQEKNNPGVPQSGTSSYSANTHRRPINTASRMWTWN